MSELPSGIAEFLERSGWGGSAIDPIPGDASFRRYFRIFDNGRKAMLMHAPPPNEDPQPFLDVADWLTRNGARAPQIYASDEVAGWVLLEDFGNDRMRDWIDDNPSGELAAYEGAIDALVALHHQPAGPFAPYDMPTYQRETDLLIEWYCPAMGLSIDAGGYRQAWEDVLTPLIQRQNPAVTVLRDYHAENIMLLGDPRDNAEQGLIDFQDALVGHPAYDLVSLLQDARRDVSPELERTMLDRYCKARNPDREFEADYARLGAQRNAKIVGIFTRLYKRDGKPRYLDLIPRVWALLERDLTHPALAPIAEWFNANIPADIRAASGGKIA
ncbi:MAG: aminoglycoside phosphotransferase [Sphingomonadales bacterium]|nr:MAG: aminoglycoside phosphotransferase [Sphingomonadales bacterium]